MFIKNRIAEPGEIKFIELSPDKIEVRKLGGEVLRYVRVSANEEQNDEKD